MQKVLYLTASAKIILTTFAILEELVKIVQVSVNTSSTLR